VPLTDEEKKKLKDLDENISKAVTSLGDAIADGATTLAKSAARSIREWATMIEKALDDKPKEGK
jgi:hypothetical protein